MQSKKPPLILLTLICFISFANAQTTMIVHQNGHSTAYPILDIVKLEFDLDTVQTVEDLVRLKNFAKCFQLIGNQPNPFNPSTNISYKVNEPGFVKIYIYDISGRKVTTLVSEQSKAGDYQVLWDGKNANSNYVSAGMYFYQLSLNGITETKKMLLIK
ncbi:MAG: T9SS type A sorting domain-containing protein [Calditrichaeota bacterium]|nr:T9SS type A sorting domain-containing protein [Calditrichota bacterium]